jgi:thioredoxin-related protein
MSKRSLQLIFVFLLIGSPLYAEGVNWRSWEAALDEAKSTNKMIMMDVIRDNCRFCIRMDENVFANEKMVAYIEKNFIPVKVNLSHREVPMGLKVEMTPTFFFFSPEKKMIKKIVGSWNQKDFYEFTDKIIVENRLKDEK